MMRLSRRTALHAAILGLICALLVPGCTEERTRMQLESMPLPEGGSVATIAVVEPAVEAEKPDDDTPAEDTTTLVAPTPSGLFIQPPGAETWRRVRPNWPDEVVEANDMPLAALLQHARGATFPASQRFVGQDGRLWLLWRAPGDARPRLLVSADAGRNWEMAQLPIDAATDQAADASDDPDASSGQMTDTADPGEDPSNPPGSANTTFRLLDHDELGLFLIMPREVWRAPADTEGAIERDDWTRIDLSGIDFSADSQPNELPSVLRNYAPPSETRPFEVLTVLGDQLRVYRRMEDASQWLMVSTLPTADRQLLDVPGTDQMILVSPTRLYRSRDFGERWDPLQLPAEAESPEFVCAEATRGDDGFVLVAATRTGGIYRSSDSGSTWEVARNEDPDARAVRDLVDAPGREVIYAATGGNGVLRSIAAGTNWHIFNAGLRASRPTTLRVRDDGSLLLGTNSGLFEAAPSEIGNRWTRLHDRSTTALDLDPQSGRTFSGTYGGAVVVREADGTTSTVQTAPFDKSESILVRPGRLRGIAMMPNSIVSIAARPQTGEVFAWSHKQGPLESSDGGNSWASMPLNAAFLSAMDDSFISNFVAGDGGTLYLLTHSVRGGEIAQMWRSTDDGDTWKSVRRLQDPQRQLPVHLIRSQVRDDTLYLSHQGSFLRTLDGGDTWRAIAGPWERARIISHALQGQTHAMVLETEHVTEFAVVTDVDLTEPTVRRLTIDWPNPYEGRRENLRAMDFVDSRAFIASQSGLFLGTIPTDEQQMPDGVAVIVTITAVFILTAVGFLFLSVAFRD